jgi:hypothetical protein
MRESGMLPLVFLVTLTQAVTPASFTTKARFSSGATSLSLPTAVATIEPRLGAPGYRWLRVRFYAFPLTPADVEAVTKGNVEPLEQRWKSKLAGKPAEYNVSNAVLQFGVDKDGKVWQVDLSVPGHTCTIAASDQEATALLQDFRFDGTRLRLKTKGKHSCERLAWDVDLTLPIFATGSPAR